MSNWSHHKGQRGSLSGRFIIFFVLVGILFTAVRSWGQAGTSSVRGTILDPQGKAVPGAVVKLTSPEKNFSRTAQSTETGGYVFTAIPPGNCPVCQHQWRDHDADAG